MAMERIKQYVRGNQDSHWLPSWLHPCKAKRGEQKYVRKHMTKILVTIIIKE